MNKKIRIKKLILNLLLVIVTIGILIYTFADSSFAKYTLLYAIFLNIIVVTKIKNIQPLLIMGIFMTTYLVYLIPHFFYEMPLGAGKVNLPPMVAVKTLSIHIIFLLCLYIFIKNNIPITIISKGIQPIENGLIFILLFFTMIYIEFFLFNFYCCVLFFF